MHFALDTSSHLKSCELFSPHLSSSHLIPSLLTCNVSKVFSNVFVSSEHWQTFLISSKFVSSCSARQKAFTIRKKSRAVKSNWAQGIFAHRHLRHRRVYTEKPVQNTLYYKACTKHFPVLLCTTKLAQSTPHYYFVLQDLQKAFPSTTLYYQACTKHFPVLLCITKLAHSTSQYYFVLQDLQKAFPSTTLYYQACSQHYFVLLSLHKALPSTTLYCKACTKHVPVQLCTTQLAQKHCPVLLCTTKLAQSRFQYYFVLQSLHKALSRTTLYYEACASTSQYYFVLQTLHTVRPSTTLYYNACTKKAFTHNNFFRRGTFTHSKLFKQRRFYTQKLLHTTNFYTEKLLHIAHFHTQQAFTHRTLTHSAFTHGKHLHTHTEAFTQRHRNFYTQQVFAHKIFYTQQTFTENILHRKTFLYIITTEIAAPKLDLGAKAKTGGTLHRRLQPLYAEKRAVSCSGFLHKTSPMQNSCSHYNAFCGITMQFASTRCRTQRRNRLTSKRSN